MWGIQIAAAAVDINDPVSVPDGTILVHPAGKKYCGGVTNDTDGIRVIADIVLQLLSYVAQTEREFIRQRQAEGIAAAKARGVHMGRAPMEIPEDFAPVYDQWKRGEVSGRGAARMLGVAQHTFTKWASAQA